MLLFRTLIHENTPATSIKSPWHLKFNLKLQVHFCIFHSNYNYVFLLIKKRIFLPKSLGILSLWEVRLSSPSALSRPWSTACHRSTSLFGDGNGDGGGNQVVFSEARLWNWKGVMRTRHQAPARARPSTASVSARARPTQRPWSAFSWARMRTT